MKIVNKFIIEASLTCRIKRLAQQIQKFVTLLNENPALSDISSVSRLELYIFAIIKFSSNGSVCRKEESASTGVD